ncbi:MAG: Acetaldehyde dehydrogenase [Mucilaginibacter sp.]|nr:Acetaldehyde dehydrogenase [Mucilaginibacter sp.]
MSVLKVAILGSGNIGTDLLIKIQRSEYLECTLFIGRNLSSKGVAKAISLGIKVSNEGINAIIKDPDCCTLVFDATSAKDAIDHWAILEKAGKTVVNMTPAKIGDLCIPALNLNYAVDQKYFNMVTCGGQAAIPIANAIGQMYPNMEYIEVVSSISSYSAGPATRLNLDEYIETTEAGLRTFSGAKKAKAILILNPAVPCIDMQTTIFARVKDPDMEALTLAINDMVKMIRSYVPGYQLLFSPIYQNGHVLIMIKVQGNGDYLPKYAGNLDIINCAAIAVAEKCAKNVAIAATANL